MAYRKLNADERLALENNGCRCENWDEIEVASPFRPEHYRNTCFAGKVKLGTTEGTIMRDGCIPMHPGVYDAMIHNCEIGDDVLINRIGNYISGYRIGDRTVIENTACIAMTGESTFGNGVEVSVLNETGGREVPIYDCLSAHLAYIIAMYRHDKELVKNLRGLIDAYVDKHRSST